MKVTRLLIYIMIRKNEGPCSIQNCNKENSRFRKFTLLAYQKAQEKGTYASYTYLKIGQQLCHTHYLSIVEPDRGQLLRISKTKEKNIVNGRYYLYYIFYYIFYYILIKFFFFRLSKNSYIC
jgi:hypothetical protein